MQYQDEGTINRGLCRGHALPGASGEDWDEGRALIEPPRIPAGAAALPDVMRAGHMVLLLHLEGAPWLDADAGAALLVHHPSGRRRRRHPARARRRPERVEPERLLVHPVRVRRELVRLVLPRETFLLGSCHSCFA